MAQQLTPIPQIVSTDPLDPSALKKRYDDAMMLYQDELQRWREIEGVFSTRIKYHHTLLGQETLRFHNNHQYHTSSLSSIVNKTSSQLMSLAAPLKERGVSLVAKGNILQNNDPDGKMARGLSDFSKEVIEQFYSPKSGVHRELVAACKDLMVYGNAAIADNWTADGFRAVALDFTRLIIETDSSDNSVSAIFRQRAPSITGSAEYEIWMRNPKAKPGIVDLRNKKTYPYLYLRTDFAFKTMEVTPLITMPIHYLRLYTIPGYPYGKGYGEELMREAKNMHSFRAAFNYSALLSLNPPIFLNTVKLKDAGLLGIDALKPGQIVEVNDLTLSGAALVQPIVQYNVSEISAFAPYEQRLELAVSKATMEEFYGLPKNSNMTTMEVAQRADEITSVLAGPISGLNKEYIVAVLENIKDNLIAQNPATFMARGLAAIDIDIIVHTRYDEQQNLLPLSRIAQAMQTTQQLMASNPEVGDNVDLDAMLREFITLSGCDPKFLRPLDVVAEIREDRKVAQQQAQNEQMAAQAVQVGM